MATGHQAGFFSTSEGRAARAMYLKIFVGGCFMLVLLIFGILSIFWGSLWKIPAHHLHGWIVVSSRYSPAISHMGVL